MNTKIKLKLRVEYKYSIVDVFTNTTKILPSVKTVVACQTLIKSDSFFLSFPFSIVSFHCLLASICSDEKFVIILVSFLFLEEMCLFLWLLLRLSPHLLFSTLSLCFAEVCFPCIILSILRFSNLWSIFFIKFKTYEGIISCNSFLLHFFLYYLFWALSYIYIPLDIFPQITDILYFKFIFLVL